MRDLIVEPEHPITSFLRGTGMTFFSAGIPIITGTMFLPSGRWLMKVAVGGGMAGAASPIGGLCFALWACLKWWAYKRVTSDPFN